MRILINLLFVVAMIVGTTTQHAFAFQIKGKCTGSSTLYLAGSVKSEACDDEVVYEVDPGNKTIIRTSVRSAGAGLQPDNSIYAIVYDMPNQIIARDGEKRTTQRIIKGFGQISAMGGYEMIVIGDDFISTAKSALDYFVLYYYSRVE